MFWLASWNCVPFSLASPTLPPQCTMLFLSILLLQSSSTCYLISIQAIYGSHPNIQISFAYHVHVYAVSFQWLLLMLANFLLSLSRTRQARHTFVYVPNASARQTAVCHSTLTYSRTAHTYNYV